ncbi:MAG: metallophosphoesterase [Oscillospiraceae bacterium]|nr:metallophosphoesterase [Oscillospiraceae bacterium]
MRLLLLADEEERALWDYFQPSRLEGIDLILSCGDLDADYLSFLVTYSHVPLVYVPGNHDTGYDKKPPEGCINADGRLVTCQGVRIVGLGGCMRYNGGAQQYTDQAMTLRALGLLPQIWRAGGFDILLTHAPARGCGDGTDPAHVGFSVFRRLMERYSPALMAHGHLHQCYDPHFQRERQFASTRVVNACGRVIVEI